MSLAQVQNTSADAVNATFAQSIDKLINGIASNIVWAIIIILVGLILGRLLGTFLAKALREIELNAVIEKMTDRTIKLEELIATTSSVIIYFLAIVLALNQVGIAAFVINTLAIGLLVLVLLLILLSLKDTLPNIVAGFTLGYKNLYSVGDEVEV
ncbi:MAG: small-conductance mechanosensitive channel, partial [Candidatus Woesearchaeota archaeon]